MAFLNILFTSYMIADSLARQFLLMHRHILRISVIEDGLGISGKSLYKWMIGGRPLPDHWEQPLYDYLYPMLDPDNRIHRKTYQLDTVVVLEQGQILPEYRGMQRELLKRSHFPPKCTAGAQVVYFRFINKAQRESILSIYSAYKKGSW